MASLLPSPLVLALPAKSLSRWFQLLHPTRHRGSAPPSRFLSCCSSRVPNKASTGNKHPQIHLSLTWAVQSGHGGSSCSTKNHPRPSGSWHRAGLAGEPRQLCETRGTVKKSGLKNNQKSLWEKITGFIFTCMPGAMGHLTGSGELCTQWSHGVGFFWTNPMLSTAYFYSPAYPAALGYFYTC